MERSQASFFPPLLFLKCCWWGKEAWDSGSYFKFCSSRVSCAILFHETCFPLNLFKNYLSARRKKLIHRIGYNLCSLSAPEYQFRLNLNNKEAKVVKYWCLAPFWKETPVLCSWWRAALNTLPQVWHRQATPILISTGSSRREADTEGVFLFQAWLIFLYHIGGLTARAHSITSPCDLL